MATDQVVGACALDCPDGCSWIVTREDGVAVKLRGNPDHPFTRGGLCTKVNSYLDHVQHPDRLLHPLRRVGPKGSGQFEQISWDDALGEIADRFRQVIDEHGAEAIWPYAGTGSVGWVQGIVGAGKRLFNHLGASRHLATICSVAGNVGFSYTSGTPAGMDPMDLEHSKLVLLWGSNALVSNQHQWPFVEAARERGATIVVIDPIRTRTARRADVHIAPGPGTDGALALALMRGLVDRGAADLGYLAERTIGWEDFRRDVLAEWNIARASEVTGLAGGQIEQLIDLVAESPVTGIRTSMGVQRHAGGGQVTRVLSCIPAVTGDYQRLGGGICYSTAAAYQREDHALTRPDLRPGPVRGLVMTRLGEGLLDLDDPPVKAIMMWGANPVVSNPDSNRVQEGLRREDLFHVVVEHFMTDTARFADIVLPGTMQTEHHDLNDSFSHLYVHWNNPASTPRGECRSHTQIFRDLASAMGLTEPALFASDDELGQAALVSKRPALQGLDFELLKAQGWLRLNVASPYQPFLERFDTLSGKFEFASERAERDGFGRLPHYVAPAEASQGGLSLVSPADPRRLNSVFGHRQDEVPVLRMCESDACGHGLADGDGVTVSNERGAFEAQLTISDDVGPGIVATTKGAWLRAGGSVNATVAERDSDMGRGAVYHDNAVTVTRICTDSR